MPGLDGLSAARHITGERLAAVLILTAFSQRDLVEQARDAGAMSYIVKPFQKSDLIPAIEVSLGRHAEMRSLEAEIGDLAERLEARKIIDRAKGVLMDQHDMNEAQSWRFLQTEAMNRRTKVHEIAALVVAGDLAPRTPPEPVRTRRRGPSRDGRRHARRPHGVRVPTRARRRPRARRARGHGVPQRLRLGRRAGSSASTRSSSSRAS